jgi:hypothetical protein
MKNFAAYYAGVYAYDDTSKWFHPWFPSFNPQFQKYFSENVNLGEYEGVAGQPAKEVGRITYERMATFDEDQAANAVKYIKDHANADKPFFMDVNYSCDRESSGEENEHEVLKPFIAIQRVQLPPGKGQPTSRKRALHGVRRRPS